MQSLNLDNKEKERVTTLGSAVTQNKVLGLVMVIPDEILLDQMLFFLFRDSHACLFRPRLGLVHMHTEKKEKILILASWIHGTGRASQAKDHQLCKARPQPKRSSTIGQITVSTGPSGQHENNSNIIDC